MQLSNTKFAREGLSAATVRSNTPKHEKRAWVTLWDLRLLDAECGCRIPLDRIGQIEGTVGGIGSRESEKNLYKWWIELMKVGGARLCNPHEFMLAKIVECSHTKWQEV